MRDKHLKRLNTPRTWNISKEETYITRPNPGAHPLEHGLSINTLLTEIMGITKNTREVNYLLNHGELLVDGKKRTDKSFMIGLMDVLSLPGSDQHFRIILNARGKLDAISIDAKEAAKKVCKIVGKKMIGKQIQLNLNDGKNILVDKTEAKVGDSIMVSLPDQKAGSVLKIEKGCTAFLSGGKHIGGVVQVEDLQTKTMMCKTKEASFETAKRYAFVVGKDKSEVQLSS